MRLIESKAEYFPQALGLEGVYKQIEFCTRISYKSEDKIAEDSAKKFVDMLIKSKHYAGLEQGTVYLYLEVNPENTFKKFEYPLAHFSAPYNWSDVVGSIRARYKDNQYSKVVSTITYDNKHIRRIYITSNMRVIEENGWQDDLQFLCSPTEHHERRYTFLFTTDRGVSHELVRHKMFCAA